MTGIQVHDFEKAMVDELTEVQAIVIARRDALVNSLPSTSDEAARATMGRMFALGSIDSAIWRSLRRIQGDNEV